MDTFIYYIGRHKVMLSSSGTDKLNMGTDLATVHNNTNKPKVFLTCSLDGVAICQKCNNTILRRSLTLKDIIKQKDIRSIKIVILVRTFNGKAYLQTHITSERYSSILLKVLIRKNLVSNAKTSKSMSKTTTLQINNK